MSERKRKLEVYERQPGANGVASAVPSFGNGTVNLYTGKPYSQRYYDILSKRTGETRPLVPRPATHLPLHMHAWHTESRLSPAGSQHQRQQFSRMSACTNGRFRRNSTRPGAMTSSMHSCVAKATRKWRSLISALTDANCPLRRAAGVAGPAGLRGHDQRPPDNHPGWRDGVRQDHPNRAVHRGGRLLLVAQAHRLHAGACHIHDGPSLVCSPATVPVTIPTLGHSWTLC